MFVLDVSPVAFFILGFQIYWYGVLYSLALIFGWGFATFVLRYLRTESFVVPTPQQFDTLMFWGIISTVLFARLGHVLFFEFGYYLNRPLEIFMIRNGGLSFHGGFIGMIIVLYLFSKKHNYNMKLLSDVLAFALAIGICIGRLANFFNQELYGVVTSSDLAVVFTKVDYLPRYPTQLYEAVFEGLVPFLLMCLIFRFTKTRLFGSGKYAAIYCFIYASSRFVIEYIKEVDFIKYFNVAYMSVGQVLCLFLFVCGVLILLVRDDRPIKTD